MSTKSAGAWTRKDLLGLEALSSREIEAVLDLAASFKKTPPAQPLSRRTIAFLFSEPSTRTRSSFEMAAHKLGIYALNFSSASSSLVKGESLQDTARNLEALGVDFIVVRHETSGILDSWAADMRASLVNAGDGAHEHPTQALLDLFTLREKKGAIKGLNVVIVGDILHSRVARSNIHGLKIMGARVTVCGPSALIPRDIERMGVRVSHNLDAAIKGADAVNVLRLQLERQNQNLVTSLGDYFQSFGLTAQRLSKAPNCLVLHPGPMNREVEIASEVADGPQSVILEQVANGVFVRMAALSLLDKARSHG